MATFSKECFPRATQHQDDAALLYRCFHSGCDNPALPQVQMLVCPRPVGRAPVVSRRAWGSLSWSLQSQKAPSSRRRNLGLLVGYRCWLGGPEKAQGRLHEVREAAGFCIDVALNAMSKQEQIKGRQFARVLVARFDRDKDSRSELHRKASDRTVSPGGRPPRFSPA
jgi:hypothetical protein